MDLWPERAGDNVVWSYPVAAAYGVSLRLAARILPPRAVVVTTCIALVMSAGSNNLQSAPVAAWLADDTGLVLIDDWPGYSLVSVRSPGVPSWLGLWSTGEPVWVTDF